MNENELLRVIAFLERMREPFGTLFPSAEPDPTWNVVAYLVKAHLRGQLVTVSALAQASGVPYATAMRRIEELSRRGWIARRPRGKTGRSFALEPAPPMMAAFVAYARHVKSLLAQTVGVRPQSDSDEDYSFGVARPEAFLGPPPALVRRHIEKGVALRFLLHDDMFFAAMRDLWADWRNNLASRKSFDLVDLSDLYGRAAATVRQPRSHYDVVALNVPWLGEFAERGLIRCLDPHLLQVGIDSLDFDPAVWAAGRWAARQYAVPIFSSIEILAARGDLFAAKGLALPRTFDEVARAGTKLHAPREGRYGMTWNAARGMPIASSFMFFVACCGGSVLEGARARPLLALENWSAAELRPRLDSDAARHALDYMHRLLAISPPDALERAWEPALDLFMSGRAAMSYCWSMRAVRLEADVRSKVKRQVRYLPHAAGPSGSNISPLGGFLLAVPANLPDERVEAAIEAIGWMTSREAIQTQIDNGFPVLPRFSMAANPDAAAGSPIVRAIDQIARRGLLHSWQRPAVPAYAKIETILGEEIHDALRGAKDDATALGDAQRRIEAAIASAAARPM